MPYSNVLRKRIAMRTFAYNIVELDRFRFSNRVQGCRKCNAFP